jgi:hypothetical protein
MDPPQSVSDSVGVNEQGACRRLDREALIKKGDKGLQ